MRVFLLCLTIVRHVAVAFLEHQVDAVSSSADLLHGLTVGHPRCTVPIDLHELVAHLWADQQTNTPGQHQGQLLDPEVQDQDQDQDLLAQT